MERKEVNKDTLSILGGAILALLALVILFSPNTPLAFLSEGITTALGFVGFWLILPFIVALSIYLMNRQVLYLI